MYVKEYCLCFPLRALIVSGLTFKSSIHFEFIFVYSTRKCPSFILLHVAVQFSWHHLLKSLSFLHCIFMPPLSKKRCTGLLWAFCFAPLVYISVFVPVPYCLDHQDFLVCYEGRKVDSSSSIFLP